MTGSDPRSRRSGILAGVLAGLVWGLSFPVPVLLRGWSPVAVTAGRDLAYGAISLVVAAAAGRAFRHIARQHWPRALLFALTGNVAYYLLLVLGIAWAGGPITDIIIGCIPITMAVVGNLLIPTYRWRSLIGPGLLVCAGLALVNWLALTSTTTHTEHSTWVAVAGILAAFGGVVIWTWFALSNAVFLQTHPEVGEALWSTVVGLGTGVLTLIALPAAALAGQLQVPTLPPDARIPAVVQLVIGSIVLGVLVSWAATVLWNVASARMSPTVAGMLINVETVSGYVYLYAVIRHWPPVGELIGFVLILLGVTLVVRLPTTGTPTDRTAPADASTG